MLVLLPPSEGKTAPRRGRPVDLAALSHPQLTAAREAVLRALPDGDALLRAPAAKASAVYTGVLFGRLGLAELPLRARRRVLIFSGLWGVLSPDDRIPAYKLPIDARLPGIGGLAAHWREPLRDALPGDALIVDMRSGGYAAAWRPRGGLALAVRAFVERDGRRTPVSHMVKATRGDVARIVLDASPPPRTPEAVAELVAATGREVELSPGTLDVIEQG
ncbi:MAG TPA: peroxide stress protein YaaA [Solirubrobacteraceae bacterium]|nr:peroxide stress protein YaaA [Solirubrobacteraceae bacterium]